MLKDYLLQNWALILILAAFAISLKTTVFQRRKTIRHIYAMIAVIFLLSIVVFGEFRLAAAGQAKEVRSVLMAVRYSATPLLLAYVIYTLIGNVHWLVFLPAAILAVLDFVSIFTGVVFRVDNDGIFRRGPLGLLPFIMVGLYCVFLIYLLFKRGDKQSMQAAPIVFLVFAFGSGVILPFVLGNDYSQIFCTTLAVVLFVYYVFSILQLTKKDSLTGLLNRQAYYADIESDPESITALISIDMNGLKTINDTDGHAAGDKALVALARCFMRANKRWQPVYRIGGDEFVIVCRRTSHNEVIKLVERIRKAVAETKYSCSVGYSYAADGVKPIDSLLKESDEMMYAEKARFYKLLKKADGENAANTDPSPRFPFPEKKG